MLNHNDAGYQGGCKLWCPIEAVGAPHYDHTCSVDPITASSFFLSRKLRSSYPYKLSKPVFGPRPDYNLWVTWQFSPHPQP
jgi:hypothetical protein